MMWGRMQLAVMGGEAGNRKADNEGPQCLLWRLFYSYGKRYVILTISHCSIQFTSIISLDPHNNPMM